MKSLPYFLLAGAIALGVTFTPKEAIAHKAYEPSIKQEKLVFENEIKKDFSSKSISFSYSRTPIEGNIYPVLNAKFPDGFKIINDGDENYREIERFCIVEEYVKLCFDRPDYIRKDDISIPKDANSIPLVKMELVRKWFLGLEKRINSYDGPVQTQIRHLEHTNNLKESIQNHPKQDKKIDSNFEGIDPELERLSK